MKDEEMRKLLDDAGQTSVSDHCSDLLCDTYNDILQNKNVKDKHAALMGMTMILIDSEKLRDYMENRSPQQIRQAYITGLDGDQVEQNFKLMDNFRIMTEYAFKMHEGGAALAPHDTTIAFKIEKDGTYTVTTGKIKDADAFSRFSTSSVREALDYAADICLDRHDPKLGAEMSETFTKALRVPHNHLEDLKYPDLMFGQALRARLEKDIGHSDNGIKPVSTEDIDMTNDDTDTKKGPQGPLD